MRGGGRGAQSQSHQHHYSCVKLGALSSTEQDGSRVGVRGMSHSSRAIQELGGTQNSRAWQDSWPVTHWAQEGQLLGSRSGRKDKNETLWGREQRPKAVLCKINVHGDRIPSSGRRQPFGFASENPILCIFRLLQGMSCITPQLECRGVVVQSKVPRGKDAPCGTPWFLDRVSWFSFHSVKLLEGSGIRLSWEGLILGDFATFPSLRFLLCSRSRLVGNYCMSLCGPRQIAPLSRQLPSLAVSCLGRFP
jgi:hypothetical protein